MESWRRIWREGFAPLFSTKSLEALQQALKNDDSRLLQGSTTTPPPLQCVHDWPVEAACFVAYCGVIDHGGFGKCTVAEAEEFFATKCHECDNALGEPAACRWFLNWTDDSPREEVVKEMLEEISMVLKERNQTLRQERKRVCEKDEAIGMKTKKIEVVDQPKRRIEPEELTATLGANLAGGQEMGNLD